MTVLRTAAETANLKGSVLMVAAMAAFAVEDMFIKSAARQMPLGQVLVMFGLLGAVAFAIMVRLRGEGLWHAAALSRPMLMRSGFEVGGRLFYSLAIALTPLSVASAILQATPLVVVAGAALLFGETVGWRRWTAITVGFVGVLVILRPGLEGFDVLSILTVLGMIGFAGRDLATRAAPPALSNAQLGLYGFAMLTVAGACILSVTGGALVPDLKGAGTVLAATVFGVYAYHSLTRAMRTGEVSVVTPFRYTRLLFALVLGMLVFGERPDALTLIGSALVVGSGLYTLARARRRAAAV
ncbi:MAG: DMT family transporter [Pseudomonadota bacterium]